MSEPTTANRWPALSAADRTALNAWGRRYKLQGDLGLTRLEAARLMFLQYLWQHEEFGAADRAPAVGE